jgi:hypothetical protein
MQKPDKPMDSIEEVENILKRLTPSALSEKATRANYSMIDGLAGSQSAVLKQPARRQHWWPTGIAASLMAGAGLVFWDQPKADLQVECDSPKNTISLKPTSDEVQILNENGDPISTTSYQVKYSIPTIEDGIPVNIDWSLDFDQQVSTSVF